MPRKKMKKIHDAIYFDHKLNQIEIAYIERWIETGYFLLDQVKEMRKIIESFVKHSRNNRLVSLPGLIVLTEDEWSYVGIDGNNTISSSTRGSCKSTNIKHQRRQIRRPIPDIAFRVPTIGRISLPGEKVSNSSGSFGCKQFALKKYTKHILKTQRRLIAVDF